MGVVLLPVCYFLTISFSSNYEAYQFPAKLFPALSYSAQVRYNAAKESYTLLLGKNGGPEAVKTTSEVSDFVSYCKNQLNVEISSVEAQTLFDRAKAASGGVVQTRLKKDFFRNYVVFFILADGTMRALVNSLKAAGWTILISLLFGGVTGYLLARYKFRFGGAFGTGLLIVRMSPPWPCLCRCRVYHAHEPLRYALRARDSVFGAQYRPDRLDHQLDLQGDQRGAGGSRDGFRATRLRTLLTITSRSPSPP
jgi:ABC-type glycerol-3-phosphate transport system permease component